MTPRHIELVRENFALLAPVRGEAARLFYDRLFALDPDLRALFKGDMAEQGRKLMAALATVVAHLDRLGEVLPTIQALGRRHDDYGVRPADYATVGSALVWTLETALGDAFTAHHKMAWIAAFTALSVAMQTAVAEARAAA